VRGRLLLIALVVLAVLTGAMLGRAATASNSVPTGLLGQGSQATAAYAITGVSYSLDPSNPRNVAQVAFTVSPSTARVVKARLNNAGSWYSCTNTGGSVSCATTSPAIAATSATNLTVVATQ
jgi:hypothetical protein